MTTRDALLVKRTRAMMETDKKIKVFIIYRHEPETHIKQIIALADCLEEIGFECITDQDETSLPGGWYRWATKQIEESNFVIVVCTKSSYKCFRGEEGVDVGRGFKLEADFIIKYLEENGSENDKFIPVLFEENSQDFVPKIFLNLGLKIYTRNGMEDLYRKLADKPRRIKKKSSSTNNFVPGHDDDNQRIDEAIDGYLKIIDKIPNQIQEKENKENIPRRTKKNIKNPYIHFGPLDPVKDNIVCIPRSKDLDMVTEGILQGGYWNILGPVQIGKTTFLRQIEYELPYYNCIYLDFHIFPSNEAEFYNRIITSICEGVGEKAQMDIFERGEVLGYDMLFYDFLRSIVAKTDKKIILLLDEIEGIPSIKNFLNIWRKVYHERYHRPELKKIALVIAGTVELIPLTTGPNSPFNIARDLYLGNLTTEESEQLIVEPLGKLQIDIAPEAVQKIIYEISGHPQLLQLTCHMLTERFFNEKKQISIGDVDLAINEIIELFVQNSNLKTLMHQIMNDKTLENLAKRILEGEKIHYLTYHVFSIVGSGPIVNENGFCAIRNNIYTEFIKRIIKNDAYSNEEANQAQLESIPTPQSENNKQVFPTKKSVHDDKIEFNTIIYFDGPPPGFSSEEEETNFLKEFFKSSTLEIEIERKGREKKNIRLSGTAKRFFCYIAYKNYKALKKDKFIDWTRIPYSHEYRLSSNPENNKDQKPEWQVFSKCLKDQGMKPADVDIRQWKYALQKKLKEINMDDVIDVKPHGIRGYFLKGAVEFSNLRK